MDREYGLAWYWIRRFGGFGLFFLIVWSTLAVASDHNGLAQTWALPEKFDWRDNAGDFTTKVKDKDKPQHCSCCWAFAATAAMEAMFKIQSDDPNLSPDIAEQQLLSCTGFGCKWHAMDEVLDYLLDNGGLGVEAAYPYQSDDRLPCSGVASDWQDHALLLESWETVDSDTESLKQKILEGPVIAGMTVYSDLMNYSVGVYEHVWGGKLGGHFVLLVGWDDSVGCWIAKNSWGADWGEQGWFRIKYQASGIQDQNAFALKVVVPGCSCVDQDQDGFFSLHCSDSLCQPRSDCDDNVAGVNPRQTEICDDGLDNDCNAKVDEQDPACPADSGEEDPDNEEEDSSDPTEGQNTDDAGHQSGIDTGVLGGCASVGKNDVHNYLATLLLLLAFLAFCVRR